MRQFAAAIGGVATNARALPRSEGVRELANGLVTSTESEAEAVRRLRDSWSPNDPSVFENVDEARSSALAARRNVQDHLADLRERTSLAARTRLGSYTSAVEGVSTDWDRFRRNYDAFRALEIQFTSLEVVVGLSELVDELRDIVVEVRELPVEGVAREVTAFLAEAAEAEDLALRQLRGTFEKLEIALDAEVSDVEASSDGVSATSTAVFVPRDPTLFNAFDTQLAVSNSLRRHASQILAALVESTSEDAASGVEDFEAATQRLFLDWDSFHKSYDDWRRTEGGCDRAMAAERLSSFTSDFAALTRRARELPGGTFLGPFRELFVEAAEREGEGLRDLRDSWRPFDVDVYGTFEARRTVAAKLLRQLAVGLDELLARFDLTLTK